MGRLVKHVGDKGNIEISIGIENMNNCGMQLLFAPEYTGWGAYEWLTQNGKEAVFKILVELIPKRLVYYMTDRVDDKRGEYIEIHEFVKYLKKNNIGKVFDGPRTANANYAAERYHVIQGFTWVPPEVLEYQDEVESLHEEELFTKS